MANTPNKFRGPSIRPVGGAGKARAQSPNPQGDSKKTGAQLRDLERTKLELDASGRLIIPSGSPEPTAIGDNPTVPPETSIGDRIVFYEKTGTFPYKVAIGVDGDRTLWFQSTGDVSQDGEEGGFDWYCSGASTGQMLRRMRLQESGVLVLGTGDLVEEARLKVEGAIALPVDFVANGGTLTLVGKTHYFIVCDATGGTCTVTLPAAADAEGVMFEFVRINAGANDLVVEGAGAETIDGAANKTLASQYAAMTVRSDGIEWWMITEKGTIL